MFNRSTMKTGQTNSGVSFYFSPLLIQTAYLNDASENVTIDDDKICMQNNLAILKRATLNHCVIITFTHQVGTTLKLCFLNSMFYLPTHFIQHALLGRWAMSTLCVILIAVVECRT